MAVVDAPPVVFPVERLDMERYFHLDVHQRAALNDWLWFEDLLTLGTVSITMTGERTAVVEHIARDEIGGILTVRRDGELEVLHHTTEMSFVARPPATILAWENR